MPDTFWNQTPRHFQLVITGARNRLDAESDARTALAYETGAFTGLAHHGKLKALKHYQRKADAQTPEQMLALLKSMGAKSNMTVTRVKREDALE